MQRNVSQRLTGLLAALAFVAACGSEGGSGTGISPGVGQGGSQDFGLFRAIVESGGIPGPAAMDDVGFFNEHKLDLPAANCGHDVCFHIAVGVGPNFINGSVGTLLLIGINTALDPAGLTTKPLNLAIAVDVSGSMEGDKLTYLKRGLKKMLTVLDGNDRITLVAYATSAEILVEAVSGDSVALAAAIDNLQAAGQTNLYDGLRLAYERVQAHAGGDTQNRVILVSDGLANTGIASDARLVRLSAAYAAQGFGITTIGVGTEFNVALMRALSETGNGTFYFLDDPAAVEEVFMQEVETSFFPLAEDVRLRFEAAAGYWIGQVYGTKRATTAFTETYIEIPSLFLAARESAAEVVPGRRGGGGGIVIQLVPRAGAPSGTAALSAGTLHIQYRVPGTATVVSDEVTVRTRTAPAEVPAGGEYDDATVAKAYAMLNLFVGMQLAAVRAAAGDYGGALAILTAVDERASTWLEGQADADITDDLRLLRRFAENVQTTSGLTPPESYRMPEPWPYYE